MSVLTCLILMIALVAWMTSPGYEWRIPSKWEAALKKWKGQLSNKSDCYVISEPILSDEEAEKRFWLLRKELTNLQQNSNGPIRVEVPIAHNLSANEQERYIACLERRFPDLTICVAASSLEDGQRDRI